MYVSNYRLVEKRSATYKCTITHTVCGILVGVGLWLWRHRSCGRRCWRRRLSVRNNLRCTRVLALLVEALWVNWCDGGCRRRRLLFWSRLSGSGCRSCIIEIGVRLLLGCGALFTELSIHVTR